MKKSEFSRSYDRDEVLGHVKQHYIDAGLLITSAAAAAAATPKPLIQIPPPKLDFMSHFGMMEPQQSRIVSNLMQVMPDITIKTPSLLPPPNGETTSSTTVSQTPDQITSILNNNNQLLLASNSPNTDVEQSFNGNNLHHNMVAAMQLAGNCGEGPSGSFKIPTIPTTTPTNTNTKNNSNNINNTTIATTSSTVTNAGKSTGQVQGTSGTNTSNSNSNTSSSNNSTWRGPAPYRCGHCHQVSNWKHVIQVFY